MSQTGKVMPNFDQNGTKVLNLTVLQRMDPYIEEILMTAAHVTFYEFNIDLNQWSRKDVEGSLFVVKRNAQPRFQFIVMNRRNSENLVENLLDDFEYEIQKPYLLYRNASQEVNGIWFYNSLECKEVSDLFTRILGAYSKVPPKLKSSSNSEFEELEAVPTTAVIEGPLEPSFAVPTTAAVAEDSSFVNFFSSAMNIGHNAPGIVNGQPYHTAPTGPLSSRVPSVAPSPSPALQVPSVPLTGSSTPIPLNDTSDPINSNNRITNLVKPSSFFVPPSSSSVLMTPPLTSSMTISGFHPPLNLQSHHGAPMLQPFPPPAPPSSLTPSTTAPNYGQLDRDKVRDALVTLVQDNQFIDMVYQALLKVHQS